MGSLRTSRSVLQQTKNINSCWSITQKEKKKHIRTKYSSHPPHLISPLQQIKHTLGIWSSLGSPMWTWATAGLHISNCDGAEWTSLTGCAVLKGALSSPLRSAHTDMAAGRSGFSFSGLLEGQGSDSAWMVCPVWGSWERVHVLFLQNRLWCRTVKSWKEKEGPEETFLLQVKLRLRWFQLAGRK